MLHVHIAILVVRVREVFAEWPELARLGGPELDRLARLAPEAAQLGMTARLLEAFGAEAELRLLGLEEKCIGLGEEGMVLR